MFYGRETEALSVLPRDTQLVRAGVGTRVEVI